MLGAMDGYGPLFGNTRPDSIGSFGIFGPDAADPRAPIREASGFRRFASVVDGYASLIAQEDDVAWPPYYSIEIVELLSCSNNQLFYSLTIVPQFGGGQNPGWLV